MNNLSFTNAVILADSDADSLERRAVAVLSRELDAISGGCMRIVYRDSGEKELIVIGSREFCADYLPQEAETPGAEGFVLAVYEKNGRSICVICGADGRGVLYGAGKAVRLVQYADCKLTLCEQSICSTPRFAVRGMQIAYRPKTNSYDAWTVGMYERYIQDLVLFGANSIELLPPGTDDGDRNALMMYDGLDMLSILSGIVHSYGCDVWLWLPNMFGDGITQEELEKQERFRDKIFAAVPYIDHIFIPGGDPGKLYPDKLFEVSKRFLGCARKYHPNVKMWISPQTSCPSRAWADCFYRQLDASRDWLGGVVFGPWERDSITELYEHTKGVYPIRNYSDICHTIRCQYPIPEWNIAHALTLGREFVSPRPAEEKHIHNIYCEYAVGSVCYSEGINDDVNKFVWLSQEWNPDTPVEELLTEYACVFINRENAEKVVDGLLTLEKNLGAFSPDGNKDGVVKAYRLWSELAEALQNKNNWRVLLYYIRAASDYCIAERIGQQRQAESEAIEALVNGLDSGAKAAASNALEILTQSRNFVCCESVMREIDNCADRLYHLIGSQLTVSRHGADGWERGAFVDCLNIPLNDYRYLNKQLNAALELKDGAKARELIEKTVINRTNPGKDGVYIAFDTAQELNCVEGYGLYENDPGFFNTPLVSYLMPSPVDSQDTQNVPLSWRRNVCTLYTKPLVVRVKGLNPQKEYEITTVYARYHTIHETLCAGENGEYTVHDEVTVDVPFVEVKNSLPRGSYSSGEVRLEFTVRDGERGPNVSEIIIRAL